MCFQARKLRPVPVSSRTGITHRKPLKKYLYFLFPCRLCENNGIQNVCIYSVHTVEFHLRITTILSSLYPPEGFFVIEHLNYACRSGTYDLRFEFTDLNIYKIAPWINFGT